MITRTSLNHAFLLRIKAAVGRALRKANKPDQPRGIGHDEVYSAHGRLSVVVVAWRGGRFEVLAGPDMDTDITPLVLAAMRRMHAKRPESVRLPRLSCAESYCVCSRMQGVAHA
jgi:hypothetical protein